MELSPEGNSAGLWISPRGSVLNIEVPCLWLVYRRGCIYIYIYGEDVLCLRLHSMLVCEGWNRP